MLARALVNLITNGQLKVEDLCTAPEVIKFAELVTRGIQACKKLIVFHLGEESVCCYKYIADGYSISGTCYAEGKLVLHSTLIGNIVTCNLLDSKSVFSSLNDNDVRVELERFFQEMIKQAEDQGLLSNSQMVLDSNCIK